MHGGAKCPRKSKEAPVPQGLSERVLPVEIITIRGPARRKTEGDGKEMFQAVCKLGLEGIVSTGCTLSLRSVESVDKSQKREGTRRNSRYRWHLLTLGFPASNLVLERTKG
jgi:hypothetical protein